MTVRYFYAMRAHSETERAHLLKPGAEPGTATATRCGLAYNVSDRDVSETTADDLPPLVCRNCRRSLRSH